MSPAHEAQSLRVLVVDDCRDSAILFTTLLRQWGHRPLVAFDGPSAIELAAAEAPDAVLLDLGLPGLDGFEVARWVRAQPGAAHAFVVALTGYPDDGHRERARRAGFDAYFVKPLNPDLLAALLDAVRTAVAV